MIGDKHVAQCVIAGRPAFLHYAIEVHDGAIVEQTWLYGCRWLPSHTDFARGRETWIAASLLAASSSGP
jgi:hypothetical protein